MRIRVENLLLGLFLTLLFGLIGCSGGGGGGTALSNGVTAAKAGPTQNVIVGTLVTMDGSQSTAADGGLMAYSWSIALKPAGSAAALNNLTSENPTFTPDLPGLYSIKLRVTDSKSNFSEDTVSVTATARAANAVPVANAGSAQSVLTGTLVRLDGSASSDANGDLLTYSWSFSSSPNGSGALLSSATVVNPTFIPDAAGVYVLALTVNDGNVNSTPATVTITATAPHTNAAPVANAGRAQNVVTGTQVTLDGSASSDADGDLLTFSWAFSLKPSGSGAALLRATAVNPAFTPDVAGAYVITLVVNDGTVNSAAASITVTATAPATNAAPVANAGPPQNVLAGTLVTLDGSGSSDADGDLLTYTWTITSKPNGSGSLLSTTSGAKPTFTPDLAGAYVFSLVVNDGKVDSTASPVTITASSPAANAAPVANAGPAQNVLTGTLVTLDGSGSNDADGDLLTYTWTITSKPNGSGSLLSSTSGAKPTFTPDLAGAYVFSLVVNDGKVDSAASPVTITASSPAANAAPVANAGPAQNVLTGTLVTLDGSGSSDADGDVLTYDWAFTSKPSGSGASLSSTSSSKPTFTPDVAGAYAFSLVVNDGKVNSSNAATVAVTATVANAAPVANAGTNQNVIVGTSVTLDGSGSSDANGDQLTYRWALSSVPFGSNAALSSATAVKPTFTPDLVGTYVFKLVVNDGKVDSSASTVSVSAIANNGSISASW